MKDPNVDEFMQSADQWSHEMTYLRRILLDCLLIETYKWQTAVYMFGTKNLIAISGLKEHCALNFFNGALIRDEEGILIKPGEHTQLGRWMKFGSVQEIIAKEDLIKAYVFEAMEAQRLGITLEKPAEIPHPEELTAILDKKPALKAAFEKLTPGRQRAYLRFFTDSKQSATRTSRIEKNEKYILKGIGLTDCICGLTKRKPSCDGSHRAIENFKR
ncbi:YdeI/OmpD-associated family protein [Aquirufa regiilacus]